MSVYIVSYDLIKPEKDYERLIEHLKSYGTWARPLKSVWVIVTNKTDAELLEGICRHTDPNDKVLVVSSGHTGAWLNLGEELNDWLQKQL